MRLCLVARPRLYGVLYTEYEIRFFLVFLTFLGLSILVARSLLRIGVGLLLYVVWVGGTALGTVAAVVIVFVPVPALAYAISAFAMVVIASLIVAGVVTFGMVLLLSRECPS